MDDRSHETFIDPRFSVNQSQDVPWAEVVLAIFLMLIGMVLCSLSYLHHTKHVVGQDSAGLGFGILGILTFVPGFYHSRIIYYAFRHRKGYDFQHIQ